MISRRAFLILLMMTLLFSSGRLPGYAPSQTTQPKARPAILASAQASWQLERAQSLKSFSIHAMTNRSLRLDSAGQPHIAYGGSHLFYAWFDGGAWHIEMVDSDIGVGWYASLALDADGYAHISYQSNDLFLKYAFKDAAGWHIQTVDNTGQVGWNTSLALDSRGYAHISYASNNALKYASWTGSAWAIQAVGNTGSGSWENSLALDGSDNARILYHDAEAGAIQYACQTGLDWQVEAVVKDNSQHPDISLVLDAAGYPHFSYTHDAYPGSQLIYAFQDAAGWHFETVDSESTSIQYTSLVLDSAGKPHLVYTDTNLLRYAFQTDAAWQIETALTRPGGIYNPSLALDAAGSAHLAYFDNTSPSIKYSSQVADAWQVETVDQNSPLINGYTSLALGKDGQPRLSYITSQGLVYASRDVAGWHLQVPDPLPPGYYGFSYTSLALDQTGYPHISYLQSFPSPENALLYAYQDANGWYTQTLWSTQDVGVGTSLALDSDGYPHIAWDGGNPGHALMYAYQDASGWYYQAVDGDGVGAYPSLALDASGYPHISYNDYAQADLKYAYQDASGWHIQVVDNDGQVGWYTSLALDQAGFACISYYAWDLYWRTNDLKYASQNASGWQVQSVDSTDLTGLYTSLALDQAGYAHISYYDRTDTSLRYAYQDADGWHIETVEDQGAPIYTSLALDAYGNPRIGYLNGDLKYAYKTASFGLGMHAEPEDGLHLGDPLTYTLVLSGTGVTAQLWNPLPANTQFVTGSLTTTGMTPAPQYEPNLGGITWQGDLLSGDQPVIRYQVTAGFPGMEAPPLSLPIVNSAWLTDTLTSRSLSLQVIVNSQQLFLPLASR